MLVFQHLLSDFSKLLNGSNYLLDIPVRLDNKKGHSSKDFAWNFTLLMRMRDETVNETMNKKVLTLRVELEFYSLSASSSNGLLDTFKDLSNSPVSESVDETPSSGSRYCSSSSSSSSLSSSPS